MRDPPAAEGSPALPIVPIAPVAVIAVAAGRGRPGCPRRDPECRTPRAGLVHPRRPRHDRAPPRLLDEPARRGHRRRQPHPPGPERALGYALLRGSLRQLDHDLRECRRLPGSPQHRRRSGIRRPRYDRPSGPPLLSRGFTRLLRRFDGILPRLCDEARLQCLSGPRQRPHRRSQRGGRGCIRPPGRHHRPRTRT